MTNDTEKLETALKSANDMCRTFSTIVARNKGKQTNWDSLSNALDESLKIQHKTMYPENYDKLSPAEAVYGFADWLTTRPERTVMSSTDDAACIADLCGQFIKENRLTDPRDGWQHNLIHPSGECSHIHNAYNEESCLMRINSIVVNDDHPKYSGKKLDDCVSEIVTEKNSWKHIAHSLYKILDDIDTASDHYKPEKSMYAHYVMEKVREKSNYMWSDGYDLFPRDSFPVQEITDDPMVDYFTDCLNIESSFDELLPEIPLDGKIDWKDIPDEPSSVDLHQTMDAQVWASEFCSMFEDIYGHKIDDEWIHSWFANSIMCGWDHQSWKRDKEYIYILKTRGGDILKVFHWEPTEKDIRREYIKHYPDDLTGGEYDIWDYIRLFRWSRSYGMTEMNGNKSDTRYEWKSVNQ